MLRFWETDKGPKSRAQRICRTAFFLQYIIASLLGCSSSIFLFISFSVVDEEPAHLRHKHAWITDSGPASSLSGLPRQTEVHRFGDQVVLDKARHTTDGHDDYFSEKLPDDRSALALNDRSQAYSKVSDLKERVQQRRKDRRARNEALRDEKRLGKLAGGLFSRSGGEGYDSANQNRKHGSFGGNRKVPNTLLGKFINSVEESVFGRLFESDVEVAHSRNTKTPHLNRPPHFLSPEELRVKRRQRIMEWEQEGIFHDFTQPIPHLNTTLSDPVINFPNDTMVVIVLSSRFNYLHRQAIRETWGKNHSVFFVIGGAGRNETREMEDQVLNESEIYRDMIDSVHPDSYLSLPYKLHFGYRWVINHMKQAKWILKADDDTFVRIGTLQRALLDLYNHELPIVIGKIVSHSSVSRKGKWAEFLYEKDFYPYWPQGSRGHVVSRPVASYIAYHRNLTYYQGEDTSIGIWLDESPLDVWWIYSPYFQNHGQCQEEEWLVIGHKLGPDDIRSCYAFLDEWEQTQLNESSRKLFFLESRRQRRDARAAAQNAMYAPEHKNSGPLAT